VATSSSSLMEVVAVTVAVIYPCHDMPLLGQSDDMSCHRVVVVSSVCCFV